MELREARIGFVGGGAMAEALLGGLLAAGLPAASLRAADPVAARREQLQRQLGIHCSDDNAEVVGASDVVVIAVKPAQVLPALAQIAQTACDPGRRLWISIAAGLPLARIESALPPGTRVLRAMPNTPALIRSGATGFCGNAACGAADLALGQALFESVGYAWPAPREALLDAVTGLSGSGPAYVFALLEALIEAGVRVGLPAEVSRELALRTVHGAAQLALESPRSPAELRAQVSSPGGTTLAGLARLQELGFADALGAAVSAATARAAEMGRSA